MKRTVYCFLLEARACLTSSDSWSSVTICKVQYNHPNWVSLAPMEQKKRRKEKESTYHRWPCAESTHLGKHDIIALTVGGQTIGNQVRCEHLSGVCQGDRRTRLRSVWRGACWSVVGAATGAGGRRKAAGEMWARPEIKRERSQFKLQASHGSRRMVGWRHDPTLRARSQRGASCGVAIQSACARGSGVLTSSIPPSQPGCSHTQSWFFTVPWNWERPVLILVPCYNRERWIDLRIVWCQQRSVGQASGYRGWWDWPEPKAIDGGCIRSTTSNTESTMMQSMHMFLKV